mmetsp:Transcript_67730/g.78640  ORF Transcript_67730/g.78640 Transcript_67730/m.78640 type:complete len:442 (+) Transcript_67730:789-2114(+)
MRARQAHAVVGRAGDDRDRRAVRQRRLPGDDHACALRGAVRRPVPRDADARRARAAGREDGQARRARRRAGRRLDSHPEGAAAGVGLLRRQGAEQEHQPRRGRGLRRRCPGVHPDGRKEQADGGPAAAGRDAADAWHRDGRRRDDGADQAQHDDPDEEEPDLLDVQRQPARRPHPGLRGRARHDQGLPLARDVRPVRHPAGAARCAADRGHVRPRRERHPERDGRGEGHGQAQPDRHHERQGPPEQVGHRAHGERRCALRGAGQVAARPHRCEERPRELRVLDEEHDQRPERGRQAGRGRQEAGSGRRRGSAAVAAQQPGGQQGGVRAPPEGAGGRVQPGDDEDVPGRGRHARWRWRHARHERLRRSWCWPVCWRLLGWPERVRRREQRPEGGGGRLKERREGYFLCLLFICYGLLPPPSLPLAPNLSSAPRCESRWQTRM